MIDSAFEIPICMYIYIINQQAIGYAADVVYMCVCVHLLYMWVGTWLPGMCVCSTRKSARSPFDFIQVFYIHLFISTFHIKGFPPRFFRQGH